MSIQIYEETTIPAQELTDGALIESILAGDQQAFEILVLRYQNPLFNFLCHFLHNYDLACDVLQDVFVKFYTSLPTLHTDKPLKSWLFQVARNRALDELRRKHPTSFSQLETTEGEDDVSPVDIMLDAGLLPEEIAEEHELQQILHQAIDELPLKYRQVVLLRYTAQIPFKEIGTILQMPQATAKTYFQRARPLLRKALFSYKGQQEKKPC